MAHCQRSLPELTPRAIALGLVLSVVMGAANVYIGLKAGMTVSASIPAAVVAMLVLRVLFRGGSILEANQVQTAASAGESLAAGVIFTMPALIMVGFWREFDFRTVTLVALSGGLLGVLFMIPMRRVFVVDSRELPYPEGVACAAVLQAGAGPEAEARSEGIPLLAGVGLGGVFKGLSGLLGAIHSTLEGAVRMGGRVLYFGGDVSPMLVAVGFIVRLNVAALIFLGGAMAWLIGIPLLGAGRDPTAAPLEQAWVLWSTQIRYVGVGAMVVGGINSVFQIRQGLMRAFAAIRAQLGSPAAVHTDPGDRDIAPFAMVALAVLATVVVAILYLEFTGGAGIAVVSTAAMLLTGFFFTAVASYIVGLVGNSNSPVSGMTITAVLFTGATFYIIGFSGTPAVVATLGVAAVVCCIACTAGDVCNDLKTGQLVGASPRRQQVMQLLGVSVACLVMAPVLQLLHTTTPGGIGSRALPAPQAALFASLARAMGGEGAMPWDMVGIGAALGCGMVVADAFLRRTGLPFRAHVMPIAVGMYLPFGLGTPILLGGLMSYLLSRGASTDSHRNHRLRRGMLFSSGVIAGESLLGIGIACLAGLGIGGWDLGLESWRVTANTALVSLLGLGLFARFSRPGWRRVG